MKKWISVLVLMGLFAVQSVCGQGLTSADIYKSFKYRMKSDALTFPYSDIHQIVNLASEMACDYGFAYPKLDTILLSTGTEEYGLEVLALWVYRVGKIDEGKRSWQSVPLGELGQYSMKDATAPNYYDFVTVMEGVTTVFDAGNDTSYIYVYPKPTSADNGDTILVHYFAWADSINSNLKSNAHTLVLELAVMIGHLRAERSDRAVTAWNDAGVQMSLLTNYWLQRIYDIEVVPKKVGGR